jgi:hypothetical protein
MKVTGLKTYRGQKRKEQLGVYVPEMVGRGRAGPLSWHK